VRYSIEATYQGLYDKLREYLGRDVAHAAGKTPAEELTYARYGLFNYLREDRKDQERCQGAAPCGAEFEGIDPGVDVQAV